jgi:signal transduction histidine kinase/DNA-binding response OmpR family regulator
MPNYYKLYQLFKLGIKGKLSLLFLLSSVLPFLLIGYYGYYSTSKSLTENTLLADKQQAESILNNIQNFLDVVPANLNFLVNFYALEQFFLWQDLGEPYKTKQSLKDARNTLYSFLVSKKMYSQLQGLNRDGQELLRIEYDRFRDKTTFAAQNELQNRHSTDYFTNTITLKRGENYFSQSILDKEHQPDNEPVIRYSTPIIDQNNVTQGVLALTIPVDNFLEILDATHTDELTNNSYQYLLITDTGEYLYPPEKRPNAQQRQHSQASLKIENSELFKTIMDKQQGVLWKNGIISTYQQFFPMLGSSHYWVLIKQTNEEIALARVHQFTYIFIVTVIVLIILVLLMTHWATKLLVHPLLQVNIHLKALAQGQLIETNIDYQQADEISELLTAVWQVKNSIKNTIVQANAIAAGNYDHKVQLLSSQDQLGLALANMTRILRDVTTQNTQQDWLKTGQTQLNDQMSGEQDLTTLTQNIIQFLSTYLQAQVGVFYLVEEINQPTPSRSLKLVASYAYVRRKHLANEYQWGEGLVGQVALEQQPILITQVPEDYIHIQSGLGDSTPRNILVMPFLYESKIKGVIELGAFQEITDQQLDYLKTVTPSIGIAVHTAQSRFRLQELLQQTQTQTEELQSQAEELQSQQEELRQANEELEERTQELERQKNEIRDKNASLEKAQTAMEIKAQELELASKYKSEFLANMSHELRTPLNSLLILAQLLAENKDHNLSNKQLEYARTISSAGADLLNLINDILDLSKVEAGRVEIHAEELPMTDLVHTVEQKFRHVAQDKNLDFHITVAQNVPPVWYTDQQRLHQIINNLLSNAFKFTSQGQVKLNISKEIHKGVPSICFAVTDSGIGIPKDKQQIIFEAFQQVDGTTSRRYGGTGLGLTISRQLANLLGGEIRVTSEAGQGSTFTLYLPETLPAPKKAVGVTRSLEKESKAPVLQEPTEVFVNESKAPALQAPVEQVAPEDSSNDDRNDLKPDDKLILVIEDDRKFSNILLDLTREKGFKCLLAEDGKTGLQLADTYKPQAIILDVGLPKIDGWTVMEKLKDNPDTRHIPVHFMSGSNHRLDAKKMGAIGYLLKPINMPELSEAFKKIEQFIAKTMKTLLVVAANETTPQILDIVSSDHIQPTLATTKAEALAHLQTTEFDCIILDLNLEQNTGIELLEPLHNEDNFSQIPVVLYANRELTQAEENLLQHYETSLTVKTVRSPERLLDEATLFLHQVEANLPKDKRQMLQMVHDKNAILANKNILIVDDDIRNTFALTTVLEDKNMEIIVAKTGKEALKMLEIHSNIDLILMDIMMPEMDGYEAIQKIRAQERFRNLPIIALTAKAMKGDKAKCIEAGANDYLSKPIDTDKLISLLRVWLYR